MTDVWFRVDVGFPTNRKVMPLTDKAFRIHVAALAYCAGNLTDGRIPSAAYALLAAAASTTAKRFAAELVTAGLWDATADGWTVHDYLKKQRSKEEAERVSNAGKTAANARWNRTNRSTNGNANRTTNRNAQTENVGDNPKEPSTTWQPAKGTRHPARDIQTAIRNGVITDHTTLEAEMRAHPALTDAERFALRALIAA